MTENTKDPNFPTHFLPSYLRLRKEACCGSHCNNDKENEPCWGRVEVVDEICWGDDWCWVHGCEGHADIGWGGSYQKSYYEEDRLGNDMKKGFYWVMEYEGLPWSIGLYDGDKWSISDSSELIETEELCCIGEYIGMGKLTQNYKNE